jgi:hypothetical protein
MPCPVFSHSFLHLVTHFWIQIVVHLKRIELDWSRLNLKGDIWKVGMKGWNERLEWMVGMTRILSQNRGCYFATHFWILSLISGYPVDPPIDPTVPHRLKFDYILCPLLTPNWLHIDSILHTVPQIGLLIDLNWTTYGVLWLKIDYIRCTVPPNWLHIDSLFSHSFIHFVTHF